MNRIFVCSVIDSVSNHLDNVQVDEKYLSSFIEICIESDFQLLIEDVYDYDRQK